MTVAWNPATPGSTAQADNQMAASGQPAVYVPSAARTASGNMANVGVDCSGAEALAVELNITAASGTTPTLVVGFEWSNDGTNWAAADPADAFTSLAAVARRFKNVPVKGRYMRAVWTIGGTTPSFTFVVNVMVLS